MTNATHAKTQHPLAVQLADSTFDKMYKDVRRAKHYVSRITGEHLSLTPEKKLLWALMLDRFLFFKSNGGDWFDNQQWLADECGVSVITVKRFIKELREHGYLLVTTTRVYGGQSNSYEIVERLRTVSPESQDVAQPLAIVQEAQAANDNLDEPETAQVSFAVAPTMVQEVLADDDDDDIFGPVVGSHGGQQDVSTTSHGAGAVLDKFIKTQPAHIALDIPDEHYADYDDRDYGYASADDIDVHF